RPVRVILVSAVWLPGLRSPDEFGAHLPFAGDWHRSSQAVRDGGMRIDAEQVVHGGQDVLRRDRGVGHVAADAVGLADDLAACEAAAGKDGRISLGPVAASATFDPRAVVDLGRTAMLAHAYHHGFVE